MPGWHPHPDVWLLIVTLSAGYWLLARTIGPSQVSPGDPAVSRGQVVAYALGILTLIVAADWPLHDLGEESLFTAHMVQHLLMTLVAPALLLMGTPGWMLRWLIRPRPLLAIVRTLSRPFVALILFNLVIAFTHWPAVVDLSVRSEPVHFLVHASLVLTAVLMWMPVLSPIAEIPRLSYPGQMLYLFAQSIVPTVPASFLTFGSEPLYRVYESFARPFGISALTDMRVAGLVMKIAGGFLLWGIIATLFFKWAKQEEEGVDDLGWGDVERELNRRAVVR